MKTVFVAFITFYQKIISPLLHQLVGQKNLCRYEVTCSEFAKEAIMKHGVVKGSILAMNRLLHCQSFVTKYV